MAERVPATNGALCEQAEFVITSNVVLVDVLNFYQFE